VPDQVEAVEAVEQFCRFQIFMDGAGLKYNVTIACYDRDGTGKQIMRERGAKLRGLKVRFVGRFIPCHPTR